MGIEQIKASTLQCRPDLSPMQRSAAFQRLVGSMLNGNFHQRPTMKHVLRDPWWTHIGHGQDAVDISAGHLEHLAQHRRKSELHTALVMEMVEGENLAQLKELNDLFKNLDRD